MNVRAHGLLLSASLALLAAGCSTITRAYPRQLPLPDRTLEPAPDDGYVDHPGVIHIHTTFSHDPPPPF